MFTFGRMLPSPADRSNEYAVALCLPCNPLGKCSVVMALLQVFNNLYPSLERPQCHGKKIRLMLDHHLIGRSNLSQWRPFKRMVSTLPNPTMFTPFPLRYHAFYTHTMWLTGSSGISLAICEAKWTLQC